MQTCGVEEKPEKVMAGSCGMPASHSMMAGDVQ